MKRYYNVYNDWTNYQRVVFETFGFFPDDGFSSLMIEVNDRNKELVELIDFWGIEKFVATSFEKADHEMASLFWLSGIREEGYPQPEDQYQTVTYDLSEFCETCGIGAKQNNPFRLQKRPNWNKGSLFELGWVFDELFVQKEFYEKFIFSHYQFQTREVVLHKTGKILEDTLQLVIPESIVPLETGNIPYEECSNCHRKRFTPLIDGFLPGFTERIKEIPLVKTKEYFGTGIQASRRIYMSKNFFNHLRKQKVKPVVSPVEPSYSFL